MNELIPPKLRKAVNALMNTPAVCSPKLRQAIEAYAAQRSGGKRAFQEMPTHLMGYVDKVTHHAYQVTDQDIEQLKESGYSEDAIFEITLCASMGASLGRLERGLSVLKGNQDAAPNP